MKNMNKVVVQCLSTTVSFIASLFSLFDVVAMSPFFRGCVCLAVLGACSLYSNVSFYTHLVMLSL